MRIALRTVVPVLVISGMIATILVVGSERKLRADALPPAESLFTIRGCKNKKPPVQYDHIAHVFYLNQRGLYCDTCHHPIKGQEPDTHRCSTCHVQPQGKAGTCREGGKTNPFHIRCVGCHQQEREANAESKAPTECKYCHIGMGDDPKHPAEAPAGPDATPRE